MRLPNLVGAFIIIIALIMFFTSAAKLYGIGSAVVDAKDCLGKIEFNQEDCRAAIKEATGITLLQGQSKLAIRQIFVAVAPSIAELLLWALIFIIGTALYRTGRLVVASSIKGKLARVAKRRKRR